MGRRVPGVALAWLLSGAAATCGGEAPAPSGEALPPVREGVATLEIGRAEGPAELTFGRVSGLAMGPGGRILVADGQAASITAFGPAGEPLFRLERRGEGPGELQSPCCLAFGPDGLLWVRDGGNRRHTAYRLHDGDSLGFVAQRRMEHAAGNLWAPVTFRGDTLIDVGAAMTDPRRGPEPVRNWMGPDDRVARAEAYTEPTPRELGGVVVERSANGGTSFFYFWPPHGPQPLRTHGPGGWWATGRTDAYMLLLRSPDGDTLTLTAPTPPGPPLSPAERERAEERLSDEREMAGDQAGRLDWGVPQRKQPLRDLWFDGEGRLWVERTTADGAPREADVWSTSGELVGRRSWPGAVRLGLPGWVGDGVALGVATDSLGVQRVVRLEWR